MENYLTLTAVDIAIIVPALGFLGACIYWAGTTNNKIRALDQFASRVDSKLDSFPEMAASISGKLDQILFVVRSPTGSDSPIRLTPLGEDIAEALSAKSWAAEVAGRENLVQKVHGWEQFEIYEECLRCVEEQVKEGEGFERRIRKGAYDHGVDVDAVKRVYAVVLRDTVMNLLGPAG